MTRKAFGSLGLPGSGITCAHMTTSLVVSGDVLPDNTADVVVPPTLAHHLLLVASDLRRTKRRVSAGSFPTTVSSLPPEMVTAILAQAISRPPQCVGRPVRGRWFGRANGAVAPLIPKTLLLLQDTRTGPIGRRAVQGIESSV